MDPHKAREFRQTVLNNSARLRAVLDAVPTSHGLQQGLQRIGQIVQTLRNPVADIDPLLTVKVDSIPAGDSAVLRIAIGCNHDPDGIETVQALVAAAPAMPPRIQIFAFTQPTPKEMAREFTSLEVLGRDVPFQKNALHGRARHSSARHL
ncbi:hypothetical protein [Azohydromonas australica]|uniref:hypothetical protein n=1 Tax=Azohydromonas australica TaxID=364039 RepID=UPI000415D0E0|nr:hypothetical protein [Azohydromonas australica]